MAVIDFCFDDIKSSPTLGYPNLAKPNLAPDDFDETWPRSIPLRLLMYLRSAEIDFNVHAVESAPRGAWYPVAFGWHDHSINYFDLMSPTVIDLLRRRHIRALFYYHEGDNPYDIHRLMQDRCRQHDLPDDCYLFISANTQAQHIDNFHYFDDHEHFFRYLNRDQSAADAGDTKRSFDFTALSRTHKWWRASCMSDLYHLGALENSLWSYNTQEQLDEPESDNPIQLRVRMGWQQDLHRFLERGPYVCDHGDAKQHNDHRRIMQELYTDSYCHLVLETHFDVDNSGGAFLTEKTFKCIKFGQPFIIVGAVGSLAALRAQGYRVFDHALDNSYDLVAHNTERWLMIRELVKDLTQRDLHKWYLSCLDDVQHNQRLFESRRRGQDLEQLVSLLSAENRNSV